MDITCNKKTETRVLKQYCVVSINQSNFKKEIFLIVPSSWVAVERNACKWTDGTCEQIFIESAKTL